MIPALVVCASAVLVLLAAEWVGSAPVKAIAKMVAATSFIAMALASGALASTYGSILLVGLGLCWIGDALLLSSGQSRVFLAGIGAFLLGHVAYSAAFWGLGLDPPGLLVGGLVGAGLALTGLRWLRSKVPDDFRIAVTSYVIVISIMVATAVAAVVAGASWWLALGALGFAVSDLFVARERFVKAGFLNAAIGLPLYFGSQLVLAWTARFG